MWLLDEAGQLIWDRELGSCKTALAVTFSPSGDELAVLVTTEGGYAVTVMNAATGAQKRRCEFGGTPGRGYGSYSFLVLDEAGSAIAAIPKAVEDGKAVHVYSLDRHGFLVGMHTVRSGGAIGLSDLHWDVWNGRLGVSAGRAHHVVPQD